MHRMYGIQYGQRVLGSIRRGTLFGGYKTPPKWARIACGERGCRLPS